MQAASFKVKELVGDIRRRWRRRALVQGAALTLIVLLFCATLLLLLYATVAAPPLVLIAAAGVSALVVLGVLVQFVLRPAFRRISDRQIALFVEEKMPGLEDRLNSAVEVDDAARLRREHGALIDRLLDDAARKTKALPLTTVVDRKRARVLAYSAAACLVAFLLFGYRSLDKIRFNAMDLSALTQAAQPHMTVSPGNREIERGASQEILVTLREDTDHDVVLVYKEGEGAWQQAPMKKGLGEPAFLTELLNIQAPVQYYVEVGEKRSAPYVLSLYEFPDVAQIDVTYRFPEYTGLPPRTEEDTGDIRGLKGSTVTVDVHTTGAVETAAFVLDDDTTIPLKARGDGRYRATFTLEASHLYFVRLQDVQNKQNKFPDEYQIVPVEDEKPYITVTDPQRDVRVNAIEEVLVAATAQDDFGIKDLRLKFSVNGGEEQTLRLIKEEAVRATETGGEHLFFLEEYGLQPGDVISYYVEAEDYFHTEAPEATDMYFIEVIPFDQKYAQANNMGGMAGQQPGGLVLSQQQIIAATWKLHRERAGMDDAGVEASRRALVQAQANLKGNIEERINATAFSLELRGSDEGQQIVAYLRDAVGEMAKALVELGTDRLKEALTPERKALNHLLKADALNKERQVAMNRGGQGGGQSATEERMTELMDLELDISKDKYEVQQQRAQQQQQQQMDEALEKVRELARKQQNLANQNRPEDLQGEDKKRFIDKLKRDQDELRQQTERLAGAMRERAGDDAQGRETQERLERVAENMREAEQALRRGDVQRAQARQQQALNELQRLQRDLQLASKNNSREAVEDLARQFDQFRDQERRLADDLKKAEADARTRGGQADREALERLQEKRRQMIDNLRQLQDQARAVQERIRDEDPELATAIRNLLQQAKREELEANMLDSENAIEQGWLDYANRLEGEIQSTIEKLETQRRAFDQSLPVTEEEQLARSLEDVRDLMRRLEAMQARTGQQQGGQAAREGDPGEQQNQGQNQGQGQGQSSDREARAEAARMQRQLEQAHQNLERLQRDLGGNQAARAPLRQLQSALTRADHTGVRLEGDAAKAFFNDRVFDALEQLEMEIARQLDLVALEKKLYGGRNADVPPEYRDLVEKYYEALAKTKNR